MSWENCSFLVVGAGIWGSVIAERLASHGRKVHVIDRRGHMGGNCRSYTDKTTGIECHAYGAHIFHTKKKRVWDYVTRFTAFTPYRHKVLTEYEGKIYPMPISLATINAFYGLALKPFEAEAFIRREAERSGVTQPKNLEEKAVSLIGGPLYEAFIKGYTRKQWNKEPSELPAEIITRLPVRTSYNTDYFDDPHQGMPVNGYNALFEKLLSHENISLTLDLDYKDIAGLLPAKCLVCYSGAIDEFFDYEAGELEWRSLRFEEEIMPYADYQGAPVINQASASVPYTRTHEYRHLHPERAYTNDATIIVREYPQNYSRNSERYYPVNTPPNQRILQECQNLAAAKAPNVIFGGRLGSYRYLDMDMAIDMALDAAEEILQRLQRP